MITLRITEAELVRDVRSVLEKIQTGSEVVIENADHSPVAVMRKPKAVGRDIDDCIRIAKAREAQGGAQRSTRISRRTWPALLPLTGNHLILPNGISSGLERPDRSRATGCPDQRGF